MKDVLFLPPSDKELDETIAYYNDQLFGLGFQFLQELMAAIRIIQKYPTVWKKVGKYTHKLLLKRFPYFVLYIPEADRILITAIAHQHRKPEYYIKKIK